MKDERLIWTGIAVGAVAILVGGLVLASSAKSSSASPTPTPSPGPSQPPSQGPVTTLIPQHRYQVVGPDPSGSITNAPIAQIQALFDSNAGPGIFTVISNGAYGTGQAQITVRYNGQQPLPLSAMGMSNSMNNITDLGV